MKYVLLISLFISVLSFAQEKIESVVDKPAVAIGGQDDIERIFNNQVIYPENALKRNISQEVTVYFVVKPDGSVTQPEFKNEIDTDLKNETLRLLRYIEFKPAYIANVAVASQSFLTFKFSPSSYKKIVKKRGFDKPKDASLIDTSMQVYTRVDAMPEYYQGEEAFKEYLMNNLEYPDIAIRQNIQGVVMLSFIVETNGTISNLVAEKEFNHFCTSEAIRVMKDTKWKPAQKDKKLVRYRTKYPIVFNLKNINKNNANGEQRY